VHLTGCREGIADIQLCQWRRWHTVNMPTNGELRQLAEHLRAEVREAKLELDRLDALRSSPGSDLRDIVLSTGSLAERLVGIRAELDDIDH
jgi:hypothetical protein